MELLDTARRLGDVPTRFVLWQTIRSRNRDLLDTYIDALEDYVDALAQVCESLGHTVRALHRERKNLTRHRQVLDRNVDQFLAEGKALLAAMAQHRLLIFERLDATYARLLTQQERELEAYTEIRLRLEAKLSEARQRREEILDVLEGRANPAVLGNTVPQEPAPDWDITALEAQLETALDRETVHRFLAQRLPSRR